MALVKRLVKGTALTHAELDGNFDHVMSEIAKVAPPDKPVDVDFSTPPGTPTVTNTGITETDSVVNNNGTSVNIPTITLPYALAAAGNKRRDAIVVDYAATTPTYVRVAGTEVASNDVFITPTLPANRLFVRYLDITDGTVGIQQSQLEANYYTKVQVNDLLTGKAIYAEYASNIQYQKGTFLQTGPFNNRVFAVVETSMPSVPPDLNMAQLSRYFPAFAGLEPTLKVIAQTRYFKSARGIGNDTATILVHNSTEILEVVLNNTAGAFTVDPLRTYRELPVTLRITIPANITPAVTFDANTFVGDVPVIENKLYTVETSFEYVFTPESTVTEDANGVKTEVVKFRWYKGVAVQADGSETKVTAGTNVTVTGTGTTASPYVIAASSGTGTVTTDATIIDGSANPVQGNAVFDALVIKNRTGTIIAFDSPANYGTYGTPEAGNITVNMTGAVIGTVQVLYHNAATEPTYGTEIKKASNSGDYKTASLNIIYLHCLSATVVLRSTTQHL